MDGDKDQFIVDMTEVSGDGCVEYHQICEDLNLTESLSVLYQYVFEPKEYFDKEFDIVYEEPYDVSEHKEKLLSMSFTVRRVEVPFDVVGVCLIKQDPDIDKIYLQYTLKQSKTIPEAGFISWIFECAEKEDVEAIINKTVKKFYKE